MVIANAATKDPVTFKCNITGTFDKIHCSGFPASSDFAVYLAITGGRGLVQFRLEINDINGVGQPVYWVNFGVPFTSPTETFEDGLLFSGVTFPAAGDYQVQLFAGKDHIGERRLTVLLGSSLGQPRQPAQP
jgi:hypothetical protein